MTKEVTQTLYPCGGHGGVTTTPPGPEQTFEEMQKWIKERTTMGHPRKKKTNG